MGGLLNLKSFLRKEVKKARVKPPRQEKPTELELKGSTHGLPAEDGSAVILDTDSLFGDPIISKEAEFEKKLQNFLSQPSTLHMSRAPDSPYNPTSDALRSLKGELQNTIYCLESENPREKRLIQRQKASLVEEIVRLEGVMGAKEKKESKAIFEEQLRNLPEPIDGSERRHMIAKERKAEKCKRIEKSKKRDRMEEELEDLDGEDRYRLGVMRKRRITKPTGHWKSDIQDHLLSLGDEEGFSEGGAIVSLKQVNAEDRILLRRDLRKLANQFSQVR